MKVILFFLFILHSANATHEPTCNDAYENNGHVELS